MERMKTEIAMNESGETVHRFFGLLKKGEGIFRSLFHTVADAIAIYDLEGKVEYINPAFTNVFGWTLEEIGGTRTPFVPESEREATADGIKEILESGKAIQDFETKRLTKDGALVDVSISGSRCENHEGEPAGMLVIFRGTTERRRLHAQLQYAQRMEAIGTLAGGIAHDFNNLLMGIQGNSSLMLLDTQPDDPNYNRLKSIEKLVQNGSKLTNQLLGYAREGKHVVRPVNLNSVIREISETFGAAKKEITLQYDLKEDLSGIIADQEQFEQVVLNLLINAADAMPRGGNLFLKTTNVTHNEMEGKSYNPKSGRYVLLSVRDTGTGMDEATMARIFEPFYTTKGLVKGTGLGLASVYGIIKGHGGYIDVQSEKGRGTTFEIFMPASEKKLFQEKAYAKGVSTGHETVLLVDDEMMIVDVGAQLMKRLGYQILTANSGKEAVKIYGDLQNQIDMVILDMVMPDMSGGETFDKLKSINPNVKVLLASGYDVDGQAKEILERGCSGFIQKPFDVEELSHKLREILEAI